MKDKDTRPLWKQILARSISSPEDIPKCLGVETESLTDVVSRYPMRLNPYYMGLIRAMKDPIYRQCIPDAREITNAEGLEDPLGEEKFSPVPGLTHRYPDRVLFLVSSQCAVFCRFCNRKRKVGRSDMVTPESIKLGLDYIRGHSEIRDVLLSGGDPLLLSNKQLHDILEPLRAVPHVEVIRVGTRVPCALPHRVTPRLARLLGRFSPLYVHTHFNHPLEITPEAALACSRLANAGIPLGNQSVLLRGVNDNPRIMRQLMHKLLAIRVRPYYLFQADLALGTSHFRTPLKTGLDIIASLQGHTSGFCVPHFALDLPGGGGKVRLVPEIIVGTDGGEILLKNHNGEIYRYPLHTRGRR